MRVWKSLVLRAALCAAMVAGAVGIAAPAQAAGCSPTSNHAGYVTYNCYMYRSSVHLWNHWTTSSTYSVADNATGVLYQGTSWFVCQRTFPAGVYYGSAANNWWAYTLSDNGVWGWVNAVYISGGVNWGAVPGLAGCAAGFGGSTSYPGDFAACSSVVAWPDGASHVDLTAATTRFGGVC